ncbi:oxidoreductase [Bryobacterales bacterium F-183]|nr:oxidoreductase [Bryobacterales bacterium F-183]
MSKKALVTGAGSGIGRAVAVRLQAAGYDVMCTGRRVAELEKTVAMAVEGGGRLVYCAGDVSKPADVDAVFAAVLKEFGRLDVLFNNAGIGAPPVPMDELTFEQWSNVVNVNLTGSFLCAQRAMAMMKRQTPRGGRIINNGSISATTPRPNSAPYTSTKHAITGLTKSIALDGREFDIACGQIDIGNAATDMTVKTRAGAQQANGTILPEPAMEASQVADAVLYMADLPLSANVLTMTVMATKMPFVGRG